MDLVSVARKIIPPKLRYAIQRRISLVDLKLRHRAESDPLSGVTGSGAEVSGPVRLGILRNAAQYHTHYVKAAQEMGVPFTVVDLYRSDWLERVREAECDAFLFWPDGFLGIWGRMLKDRVRMLEEEMGYLVMPSTDSAWMFEDKRRMAYWLGANSVPHPQTWVFYDRAEADAFAQTCALPLVFKTPFGAAASGVEIVKTRKRLRSLIARSFKSGIPAGGSDHRDREWGVIVLQEHVPIVREWRMVRIGDSYFGHPKGQVGEFHSGSGVAHWDIPSDPLLDMLHDITERGGFRSMDVDIFETEDGRFLVNELQAVFGASTSVDQSRVDGQAGRFVRREGGGWEFEAGEFARNACANERIRDILARLPAHTKGAEPAVPSA